MIFPFDRNVEKADILRSNGNYNQAINVYQSVSRWLRTQADIDTVKLAMVHRYISYCYLKLGNLEEARHNSMESIKFNKYCWKVSAIAYTTVFGTKSKN